ncbi:MAG: alpha-glucan family phosphorylase [Ilumatobacteraceae bacterium]|nr:alpha-glucan family phosphorylase [Ilumatobacteraceae bacterium]
MQPVHTFTVYSRIPDSLAALAGLADNLHWVWDRRLAALFDRLDGTINGVAWRASGQHPADLVRRTSPGCWEQLAADPDFVGEVAAARARLDTAETAAAWFDGRHDAEGEAAGALELVAYFSPEFGITEAVPQYSGGLGVLAGDHLKASSDLGIPLIGVGLLYGEGYFHQYLDPNGWQEERNDRIDPRAIGLRPTGVEVQVELAGVPARVRVWRVDVGRIALYLLDTNVAGNPPDAVAVTNRLYGGDEEHRLRQEIVLGIGGVRALRALDIHPQVFHTNEGHAGFLGLERVREWTARGLDFDAALEATRAGGVFTTHTPVPAGIDRFPRELFERYFGGFAEQCGVDFDTLYQLGVRDDEGDGTFNMAVMGLRVAARANGVAQLHGEVSREMFGPLWPALPMSETPIGHVTNGVHARSWVSDRVDELLTQMIGDDWHLAGPEEWERVHHLDRQEVWDVRRAGRAELVALVRSRMGYDLLDPDVLTIGFARRFATYKRSTLLLQQLDRLRALLLDPERPVQFVFAGKAHPADHPGKSMIQEIHRLASEADVRHRFVFLPDYDIGIARTMYHGCDVWLNTPRRPMEACGTSGMKAALNGVLNCSIRDGWWDEMSNGDNGWDIPSFDDSDIGRRDHRESSATFDVIENQIRSLFYDRNDDVPTGWVDRITTNWATLGWRVTASRMVRDYVTTLYEPAAASANMRTADGGAASVDLAAWKARIAADWSTVSVRVSVDESAVGDGNAGSARPIVATVDAGALAPTDLVVQALHGPLTTDGTFDERAISVVALDAGDDDIYRGEFVPDGSGPWGVSVRALPTHPALTTVYETGLVATG